MSDQAKGYLFIMAGTFCVGAVSVTSKLALDHMSTLWFLTWIYAFSTVMSYPFGKKFLFPTDKKSLSYFSLHICGIVFGWYFSMSGLQYLDAPTAAFISRFEFPIVMTISMFFLHERLGKIIYPAILISVIGVLVMTEEGILKDVLNRNTGKNWGIFLVMIAAFGFALGELGTKFMSTIVDSRVFTFIRNIIIFPFFLLTALVVEGWVVPSAEGLMYAALCALAGPVLARIFYMESLKRISLGHATVFTQLEPVHSFFFAFCLGMELPDGSEFLGGVLILISCLLLVISEYRRPDKQSLIV
jgi:drug/metabolite transporter (DMT)-like permease